MPRVLDRAARGVCHDDAGAALLGPQDHERAQCAAEIHLQAKAKGHLHDIWQAGTKAEANAAFDFFVATYGVKWDKAVAKLVKDRDALLTFYDYPAEHWKHIRTSNPIESTFATVRHRTKRTKGCLSRKTGLAMAFRLMMSAQKKWRKLDGQNRLPEIIQGVEFRDGLRHVQAAA